MDKPLADLFHESIFESVMKNKAKKIGLDLQVIDELMTDLLNIDDIFRRAIENPEFSNECVRVAAALDIDLLNEPMTDEYLERCMNTFSNWFTLNKHTPEQMYLVTLAATKSAKVCLEKQAGFAQANKAYLESRRRALN